MMWNWFLFGARSCLQAKLPCPPPPPPPPVHARTAAGGEKKKKIFFSCPSFSSLHVRTSGDQMSIPKRDRVRCGPSGLIRDDVRIKQVFSSQMIEISSDRPTGRSIHPSIRAARVLRTVLLHRSGRVPLSLPTPNNTKELKFQLRFFHTKFDESVFAIQA